MNTGAINTYLLTIEAAVILDNLNCSYLINDIGKLYITEEHYFFLKAQNKKYNFPVSVDRNGQETNELPSGDYDQLENIQAVMHHYHNVLDIMYHPNYNNCKQIWNILFECVQKYKTPLPPNCKSDNYTTTNSLSIHHDDKKLCLKAKFNEIDETHIKKLVLKEYNNILNNNEYKKLLTFVNSLIF